MTQTQSHPEPCECFAILGDVIIDVINPGTGRTAVYGKTLEQCQTEHPNAQRMTIDAFCVDKGQRQDSPIQWEPITEQYFYHMLEILPPAMMNHAGFLVGEPWDHHAITGRPRYQAFCQCGDSFTQSNRPMTIAEFRTFTESR